MSLPRGYRVRVSSLARPLFFALLLITLLKSATTDPFMADAVIDPPFTSLTYGVQAFLWWDPTSGAQRLDAAERMVFSHVKQTFAWKDVQPVRGAWIFDHSDWILEESARRNLKIVARLSDTPGWALPETHGPEPFLDSPPANLDDFAQFCGTLASRYAGRIAAYQIWNEPNLAREWNGYPPDAAGYVALLKACSDAIRAADPNAILISAGLSPTGNYDVKATPDDLYLQAMYDAGFQQYVDVVGVHAPGYSNPELSPDEAAHQGSQRFFTFRHVEDLRKIMIANGDAARQMAILEVGWTRDTVNPSYSWFAVNEKTQARHLVAAYQYAADHWRPWVGLMSTIYMADSAWTPKDEEYYWSIISPEGWQLRPYISLANMAKYCGNRVIPARAPDSPEALGLVKVELCQ
jgi:polysaccharide biosynthesis protein PslG